MPVPTSISDLNVTPALNSPAGSESPTTADDYFRVHAAFIKQVDNKAIAAQTSANAAQASADGKLNAANPSYTGTLTGGTGVVNLGSGQFVKDASGNVGIGTSSPAQKLSVNGNIVTAGEVALSGSDFVYSWAGGTTGQRRAGFYLDGTNQVVRFYTVQNEVARIDSSGNLLVGTTSAPGAGKMRVAAVSSGAVIQLERTTTSAGSGYIGADSANAFNVFNGSQTAVFFTTQGGATYNITGVYGNASDVKLKENIVDARGYLSDLCRVRVVKYSLKADAKQEADKLGVIAQELEQVFPGMVEEVADHENGIGEPTGETTKIVKHSVFVPMLIKAIQEQQAIIESLSARITALESV